jgi:hypothetical protein
VCCITGAGCMVATMDSMSSGETETNDTQNWVEWDVEPTKKKKGQKRIQIQATRQSSRLKCHRGKPVEELAARRKKVLNLEVAGNKNLNSFDVLNNIDDNYLLDTAKDLGINLASDKEGCLTQISAIKAEERLRPDLAEVNYLAHLNSLKERDQGIDMLDMSIIGNGQRGFHTTFDSNHEFSSKKARIGRV